VDGSTLLVAFKHYGWMRAFVEHGKVAELVIKEHFYLEQVQKDNDASSRYLSYWNIYIYLEYDSLPDDFKRFRRFFLNGNGHTDGRTDIRTDIRTDRPFYRDARTHLKTEYFIIFLALSIFFLSHS